MTGTLTHLFLATFAFVGGHFLISETPIRGALVGRLGEGPYKGVFSLLMAAALVWMIWAFVDAPFVALWTAPVSMRHLPLTLMVVALILVVGADMGGNPTKGSSRAEALAGGPKGLNTITRHPLLWGIALWAALHIAANGDAAAVIFFGGFLVLAFLGTLAIDAKKKRTNGQAWVDYMAKSSNLPFAAAITRRTRVDWRGIGWKPVIVGLAAYILILVFHETLFGIAPASFVSGLFG